MPGRGVGFLGEDEATWSLVLHQGEKPLSEEHTRHCLAELAPLFQEAFCCPGVLTATARSEPSGHRIPPAAQQLGIKELAIVPLMTLQHRLGAIVVGREGLEAFFSPAWGGNS